MTKMLSHSDTVSGTTVFDDGTKVHWTEGRGSSVAVKLPTGEMINIVNAYIPQPIWDEMKRIEENGADECRAMTPEEEREWYDARYPDGK